MPAVESLPIPPDELIDRVVSGFSNEDAEAHRRLFLETGRRSLLDFEAALRAVGSSFERHPRVLEFGCGCGRIMRWMAPLADRVELAGTDIDERAIAWAAESLPFARFGVNAGLPPTSYEDGRFDLVLNHSVFTHLDAAYQDAWLGELQRITAPGGLLVLSVHGEHAFAVAESQLEPGSRVAVEWRATLERDGILFVAEDSYVGSAFPDFYHTTFHAPWYLFEHWGQWFEVLAYLPKSSLGFQDQLVLRRREQGEQPVPPVRANAARVPAAPPSAPAAGVGDGPAQAYSPAAIASLQEPSSPSRFGAAGLLARRALFRLARPVIHAQSQVNSSTRDALVALNERIEEGGEQRMPPLVALALRQQAERIERVERELREQPSRGGEAGSNSSRE